MANNVVISTLGYANPPLPPEIDKWDFEAQAQWMLQFMQQKDANIPPETNITVDMESLRAYANRK